jgi:transcriptional regulator with XRE-family HTH domain
MSGRSSERGIPVAASIAAQRSIGIRVHCDTACEVMEQMRATTAGPPALEISSEILMPRSKPHLRAKCKRDLLAQRKKLLHTERMGTELWQRIRFARKHAKVTQQEVADVCGISREAVAQWESADQSKRTVPLTERIQVISKMTHAPLTWLLSSDSELSADAWNAPTPIFTPERRADDDVTAVQIAIESLCAALLHKVPGASGAFLADMRALCRARKFSPDYGLLGSLHGIAEPVRVDEEAATRGQQRAGSARHTKRGT